MGIIKHTLDLIILLFTVISMAPSFHQNDYTILLMTCEGPCELSPHCFPISSWPAPTCYMPHSFPRRVLCTCFSHLQTFFLHSFPLQAPSHNSELCSDITSSRTFPDQPRQNRVLECHEHRDLSTAEFPVSSTEPDMWGQINICWTSEWIEWLKDTVMLSLIFNSKNKMFGWVWSRD